MFFVICLFSFFSSSTSTCSSTLPWFHSESNIYSLKLTCSVFRSQLLSLPWGRAGTSGDVIWRTNTSSSIVSYAIYLFCFIFHSDGDMAGRAQAVARRAAAQHGKTRNRPTATQQAVHRWRWQRHNEHAAAAATQRACGGDTTSTRRRHNEATQ